MLVEDFIKTGWVRIPKYLSLLEIETIDQYMDKIVPVLYKEKIIKDRYVYLSDKSEARISNAHMISLEPNDELPSFQPIYSVIDKFLSDHNSWLSNFLNSIVPESSRSLINFQVYSEGSKPIPEHFDGEYIDYTGVGYDFRIKEALVPSIVAVVTLYNQDPKQRGTVIRDINNNEVHIPKSEAGDLLLFDNLRFRHSVPELKHPRAIIGLRNFDFCPYHFVTEKRSGYVEMKDRINPGWIKQISSEEATIILKKFINEIWPIQYEKAKNEGAVF